MCHPFSNHLQSADWINNRDAFQIHHIFRRSNIGSDKDITWTMFPIFDPIYLASKEQSLWSPLQCNMMASTISTQSRGVRCSFSANSFIVIWMKMLRFRRLRFPIPRRLPLTLVSLTRNIVITKNAFSTPYHMDHII